MKVVHVNNFDLSGGAARAAYSIHTSLMKIGIDSKYLVQKRSLNDSDIFSYNDHIKDKIFTEFRSALDTAKMHVHTRIERTKFSYGSIGIDITKHKIIREADIINLHWINNGFLSLNSIKKLIDLGKPIVWSMHDMWAFTGGCHYVGDCIKYKNQCAFCPALKRPNEQDSSFLISKKKEKIFGGKNITFVGSSIWMRDEAIASKILSGENIINIPTAIDVDIFKNIPKEIAKEELGLSKKKLHILFGTWSLKDKRKGFHLLDSAIHKLKELYKDFTDIEILLFGRADANSLKLPYPYKSFGRIQDSKKLAQIYSAADFSVVPSLEDNLPNTVMESLSCGTPVLAFNIGGIPDMINHKLNGFLVNEINSDFLADGMLWFLQNRNSLVEMSKKSRIKVEENFTFNTIGNCYKELYRKILKN